MLIQPLILIAIPPRVRGGPVGQCAGGTDPAGLPESGALSRGLSEGVADGAATAEARGETVSDAPEILGVGSLAQCTGRPELVELGGRGSGGVRAYERVDGLGDFPQGSSVSESLAGCSVNTDKHSGVREGRRAGRPSQSESGLGPGGLMAPGAVEPSWAHRETLGLSNSPPPPNLPSQVKAGSPVSALNRSVCPRMPDRGR
ncbi:hypothetical protein SKAU_G00357170 [Synaphobranchus kaupii]|uniref:Uncharacterized protein n=1 Tax=Synaphobranchus kaupii TaxID=118154 RepID=A0A9Q1EHJ1_SYNKA|nr:hypothetical protein SKAU_G00357170 [Synaphobranchus kaupii]